MHYATELATLLLAYESCLLAPPWHDEPTLHVTKLREIIARHFASLSPDEFGLLRKIMNLHAAYKQPPSIYALMDDCEDTLTRERKTESFRNGTLLLIEEFLQLIRRGMDESELDHLAYTFPDGKLPDDVTDILNRTYGEILQDYANGCNISAISLCGKVLETCLSALYVRICGTSPDDERLGFNAIINRLKKAGYEFHSATNDQMAVISAHRNKAIHGSILIPTRDEARGVISLTKDVMLKAASK